MIFINHIFMVLLKIILNKTPLHYAITKNNIEIIKLLLACSEIDINIKSNIFKIICYIHEIWLIKFNYSYDEKTGIPPLYTAIRKGNIEIIKLLLAHPKIDVNMKGISIFCLNVILNLFFFISR